MGTPFTEGGIRDYLLLLSIYQTLRYRNLSFWKFLLSGETDPRGVRRQVPLTERLSPGKRSSFGTWTHGISPADHGVRAVP